MKRLGWHNIVFWMQESDYDSGYEEIRKRTSQEQSGAFPDVFAVTNSRFKGTESRSEPRVRFRLAAGKSGYYLVIISGKG